MKTTALCVALAFTVAAPAYAQFGAIGKIKNRVDQAKKIADIRISEKDERAIGEDVSGRLVNAFGVHQDPAVARYVTLVGTVIAQGSERPNLDWQFIVLDSDGVNAYAAPGGIVHITRGALAFIKSEAELAGVLAHEITHVTARHTIRAIQKAKSIDVGTDEVGAQGGLAGSLINRLGDATYKIVFENSFNRDDELESDKVGLQLANKAGYSPSGLTDFLTHLSERNKDRKEPNGLFASHPLLKERIEKNGKTAKEGKLTATASVQARYASTVKVEAKPMAAIVTVTPGARGVTADAGSKETAKPEEKKEEPKKKGFGLGGLSSALSPGKQAESTQASASAGGRMATPDTDAAGGTNRNRVRVALTAAEIAEFKKGIA
jgi:predicted Zn-dependent protease